MCEMVSFLYKYDDNKLDIAVYDLMSHSNTQEHFPDKNEVSGWYEGHYTKDKIECRIVDGRNIEAEKQLKFDYPEFIDFVKWCLTKEIKGKLDLSGCNLKDIKLPKEINGSLNLKGCDLKGINLPEVINGYLNLNGCKNSKGIKLPKEIKGDLDISGCNLKGIKLPKVDKGSLYLYLCGCDLKRIDIPKDFNLFK